MRLLELLQCFLFAILWEKEREVVGIGEVCVQFNFVCLCGWKREKEVVGVGKVCVQFNFVCLNVALQDRSLLEQ